MYSYAFTKFTSIEQKYTTVSNLVVCGIGTKPAVHLNEVAEREQANCESR